MFQRGGTLKKIFRVPCVPAWPQTCYIARDDFELPEVWDIRCEPQQLLLELSSFFLWMDGMCHHTWQDLLNMVLWQVLCHWATPIYISRLKLLCMHMYMWATVPIQVEARVLTLICDLNWDRLFVVFCCVFWANWPVSFWGCSCLSLSCYHKHTEVTGTYYCAWL